MVKQFYNNQLYLLIIIIILRKNINFLVAFHNIPVGVLLLKKEPRFIFTSTNETSLGVFL